MTRIKWAAIFLALAFVALLAPVKATAQTSAPGTFYIEEVKEGRIYVFYFVQAYGEWKTSGEMGKSVTRVGYGPNGETVVFDSNEAVNVYNAKHNLSIESFPVEKKPKMSVGWKDGKTTIETDNAALIISNRVQVRYTQTEQTSSTPPPGLDQGDSFGSFRIRRAKTKFEGWFYRKWMTYELQMNWPASGSALEDANFNIDVTKGNKSVQLKAGQFKVPFGRQELTSSGSQEFVDRSIVSNRFAVGRDIGFQAWGEVASGKLDWRAGIFNGNGINQSTNENANFQVDARLTFQPWGDVKYSEGDFESTDKPLLAVAVQYETEETGAAATSTTSAIQRDLETIGFDAVLKYKGLFVFFEDFERTTTNLIAQPNTEVDDRGYNFQAGYFVVPKTFEVAFRYAEIDPNKDSDNDKLKEYGIAFGYFYNKHSMKLQGDFRRLENEALSSPLDEINEFRLQLQFIF